jgi:anti-anti-sigma factor
VTDSASESTGQQLFAELRHDGGVLTAVLVGPSVGGREAPIISRMVQDCIQEHAAELRFVVLDFSNISFVNSSGLGACIEIHNLARTHGTPVVLYGMREDLRNLFKITRLDKLFKVVDDEGKLAKLVGG